MVGKRSLLALIPVYTTTLIEVVWHVTVKRRRNISRILLEAIFSM
jgi:hypothetical protein